MKKIAKRIIELLLAFEATLVLRKYKPKVIAVTGTVGKTTTKDVIYSGIAPCARVRKSPKSYNSEIGLPLTILGAENQWTSVIGWLRVLFAGAQLIVGKVEYPEVLVLEVGADRPNDIQSALRIITPDVAVITWFGDVPVHVEFYDSPGDVYEEKMLLAKGVRKNGTVIVNGDDPELLRYAKKIVSENMLKVIGSNDACDAQVHETQVCVESAGRYDMPVGEKVTLMYKETAHDVHMMGTLGQSSAYPMLISLVLADMLGYSLASVREHLEAHAATPGRMRLIRGQNDTTIIDDSYNASPAAFDAALTTLAGLTGVRKKIVVAGDMLELGQYSSSAHKDVGEYVADVADSVVTVGFRAKKLGAAAKEKNKKITWAHFDDHHLISDYVRENMKKGDVVLVKGSQGARMEKVVRALMAEPLRAGELLVRQEKEWKGR